MQAFFISTKATEHVQKSMSFKQAVKAFPNVVHQPGVAGHTINITDDTIVHQLARYQINNPDLAGNESIYALPSMGALGCFLAHVKCWEACANSKESVCVIEEDYVIPQNREQFVASAIQHVPDDAVFASLAYIRAGQTYNHDNLYDRMLGPDWGGTQMYWIAPTGAQLLLKHALPIWTQVDLYIGIQAYLADSFKAYVLKERLYPILNVVIDNAFSQVQSFAIKKYLPRNNKFYIILIVVLIYLLCDFAWRFKWWPLTNK